MQRLHTPWSRSRARRNEGAAMLVVTLMLLIGTTIAAMTVYALSLEIRSTGYYRQQAQTHYVAEAGLQGVLSVDPTTLATLIQQNELDTPVAASAAVDDPGSILNYDEPDPFLLPGGPKHVYQMSKEILNDTLAADLGAPAVGVGANSSIGLQAFTPWYIVHFSDLRYEPAAVVGEDASGNSPQQYVIATATVRGRTLLDDGTGTGAIAARALRGAQSTVGVEHQMYTDGAYDMRATVRLGPVTQ